MASRAAAYNRVGKVLMRILLKVFASATAPEILDALETLEQRRFDTRRDFRHQLITGPHYQPTRTANDNGSLKHSRLKVKRNESGQ